MFTMALINCTVFTQIQEGNALLIPHLKGLGVG